MEQSGQKLVAQRGKWWPSWRAGLPLVLVGTFALYVPHLNDWFWADDFWFIRAAEVTPWKTWLKESFEFRSVEPVPEFHEYRPLFLLAFKAQYSVFGLHAWAYHLVSLASHLVAVALLWFVAMRLLQRAWAATLTAALFAFHPALIDNIVWISSFNAPMATVFALSSFLLFMKFTDGTHRRLLYYAASMMSLAAAILFHPATAPIAVVMPVWYFVVRTRPGELLLPRSWLPFVPIALIIIPNAAIFRWVRSDQGLFISYRVDWHMIENYIEYFGLAIYPFYDDRASWFALGIVVMVMGAVLLTQLRWSVLALFAVFWFLVSLAPVTTWTGETVVRWFYFAGPAWAVLVAVAAMRLSDARLGDALHLPVRSFHPTFPFLAGAALIVAAALMVLVHGEASKTFPLGPTTTTVESQSEANREFIAQLQEEVPELPPGGVLYVVHAPLNLIVFHDNALERLVELHYGEAIVKSVPLRSEPFWDEDQTRAELRLQDRLFIFESTR